MAIYEQLREVQQKLKAPKWQKNNFGGYKYRSCEDILEAVKPILNEVWSVVLLSDEIKAVGERVYVEATATFTDGEDVIEVKASAREASNKKGMDDSQITGAASSYARKYALNGLFAIDDTKDSDYTNKGASKKKAKPKKKTVGKKAFNKENFDKLKKSKGNYDNAVDALLVAKRNYKVSKKWESEIQDLF